MPLCVILMDPFWNFMAGKVDSLITIDVHGGVLNLTHSCSRPQTVAYSPAISWESNEPRAWGCYF